MLLIRDEQMKVLEKEAFRRFEDEMVVHSKSFSPRLCQVIGDTQLRLALNSAIHRADDYGFTLRGPIRLFIELMFLFGSAFDTDPQYPKVGEFLRDSGDQMQRAENIHQVFLDYFEKVSGPDAINVHNALRELSVFARMPITISSNNFVADMLDQLFQFFPQKADYVGQEGLEVLIHEGCTEAKKHCFYSVRAQGLLVVLMFSFGHGCTDDPLYPWISRTLRDERIVNAEARAARLERKVMTWLEHVLAENAKGAHR